MENPDYGEPLFGLLSSFEERLAVLHETNERLVQENRRLRRDADRLRDEVLELKEKRKSERERLCEWLDRRIVQQEGALKPPYVSGKTKHLIEIELSLLRRYRDVISTSGHTKGTDDPLMPNFA